MQGCVPRFSVCFGLFLLMIVHGPLCGAEVPSAWIEDAQLHDVKLVGSRFAVAVGEHGAVWKSTDGGSNWMPVKCDMDVSLRSVSFLDDRMGWIAGSDTVPFSGLDAGVLLATRDGGLTWDQVGKGILPPLNYVKFFGPDEGIVVGQPTSNSPSGIFKTTDGGKTWHGVQGESTHRWKAMSFPEFEMGVVAGVSGRVSLMGGDQLYASKLQPQGYRSVRGLTLSTNDSGWLVGDGGLVLKTSTGGVVWESPDTPLPEELRDGMDFRCVEARDQKVWLSGSPGSVIWHSPDGGRRWQKQLTGETASLAAIRFSNDKNGIAVGAFGLILRTIDGGATWTAVHGGGRQAALLAIHARSGRVSPPLITRLSGAMGYRSAVWVAQREDVGPLALSPEGESVVQSAVQKSGGHVADVHWQLPQIRPGIEYSSEQTLKEWQKQTEGRLPQTLLGSIVRQIRTWRPAVVVLDQPSPDDAPGQLLFDAALRAVAQAADATQFEEQTQITELGPWKVDRVYLRLAAGATGDTHVELDEFLMPLKTSTRNAAAPGIALLQSGKVPVKETSQAARIAYRWIGLDGAAADERVASRSVKGGNGRVSREFFGGSSISPGSAARRELLPIDETNLERSQKLVEKQRNLTGVFQKTLDDPRMAGQMIGQINGMIEGMEPAQAVALLRDLADEYRKRSEFELVESTYVELIRRYPHEPGSLDAMRWLIQFWASSETAWQRVRAMKSDTAVSKQNRKGLLPGSPVKTGEGDIQLVSGTEGEQGNSLNSTAGTPQRIDIKFDFDGKEETGKKSKEQDRLKVTREVDWRSGAVMEWHGRATELAKQLQKSDPSLFQSVEIQFPLAAMRRLQGSSRASDSIVRNFVTHAASSDIKQLAERELWASFSTPESPKALTLCYATNARPHLDGLLSEACWADAKELYLTSSPDNAESADDARTLVMFAYDAEFLYLGLKVPKNRGTPADQPRLNGRYHDADLTRFDRVSVRLDVDRDYATWYEFQIDQRGWTAESCWEDRRWDPTWYVAAEADETDWRVEAAIPWSELGPNPPRRGSTFGVSILRTIPNVGLQSWNAPAAAKPSPASFGLLKFE